MAANAVARETIVALRHQIAKIEGTLPERLRAGDDDAVVLRRGGRVLRGDGLLRTGVPALDEVLGGGLPKAALTEIHGRQMRDAGAVAGFVLALVSLLLKQAPREMAPLLWIGTGGLFAEIGLPYAHGISRLFGIAPGSLLLAVAPKSVDALWIAQEASALKGLAAVIVEVSGNPQALDLTATRRLDGRAVEAGRPLFLLRYSAQPQPTAAPLRFLISPAPAGERRILGQPWAGSIGPPAFMVDLDKNRLAPPARFLLEWNVDERSFEQRETDGRDGAQDPVAVVPVSPDGADMAPAAGSRLAIGSFRFSAAGGQPSR